MNPLLFALVYIVSWLLIGLGVFIAFRLATDPARRAQHGASANGTSALGTTRVVLVALGIFLSLGITYAGAYTFYNLVVH